MRELTKLVVELIHLLAGEQSRAIEPVTFLIGLGIRAVDEPQERVQIDLSGRTRRSGQLAREQLVHPFRPRLRTGSSRLSFGYEAQTIPNARSAQFHHTNRNRCV